MVHSAENTRRAGEQKEPANEGRNTLHEIAAALSINAETAKKRIQRARAKLRKCVVGKLDAILPPSIRPQPKEGGSGL